MLILCGVTLVRLVRAIFLTSMVFSFLVPFPSDECLWPRITYQME